MGTPLSASQPLLGPEVEEYEQSMLTDQSIVKDEIKEEIQLEWDEIEAMIIAREQGKFWDQEGVEESRMSILLEGREDQIPTNHDCVKEMYDYETEDDLTIPDELHYRWCKPPGSALELFRRHKHRERRSSISITPPSREETCGSRKGACLTPKIQSGQEGLELDKPAQTAY